MTKAEQGLRGSGLTKEQKEVYLKTVRDVLENMTEGAVDRFDQVVVRFEFYTDTRALTKVGNSLRKIPLDDPTGIQGMWDGSGRVLHLDGPGKVDDAQSIYAHEFSHVLDWPNHKLSSTPEWGALWKEEIANNVVALSDYANAAPSEGFAEFGRLVFSNKTIAGQTAREHAKSLYPRAYRFWEDKGLLPQVVVKKPSGVKGQILKEAFNDKLDVAKVHIDMWDKRAIRPSTPKTKKK